MLLIGFIVIVELNVKVCRTLVMFVQNLGKMQTFL